MTKVPVDPCGGVSDTYRLGDVTESCHKTHTYILDVYRIRILGLKSDRNMRFLKETELDQASIFDFQTGSGSGSENIA